MSTTRKVLIVFSSAFGFCLLGWIIVVGAVYAWGGVMTVRVENSGGPDLSIPVPMAVVGAALATGERAFDDLDLDRHQYGPMLREILEVLDDCPDVTFVEVEDGGDYVRVSKKDGRLHVQVRERGQSGVNIEVSLPSRSIARLVS